MSLFWCQIRDDFMLRDMNGMKFLKFELKKNYRATNHAGSVKCGPVLTNGRALSLSFKIKKIHSVHITIECLKNNWKENRVCCCYGWSDIFATK